MRKNSFTAAIAAIVLLASVAQVFAKPLAKPSSKNPEAQKFIDKAWALYKSDVSPETFKQCILLMEQADKLDPMNTDILTDLARYQWNFGDLLPKSTPEQKKILESIYAKGLSYADKSLKIKETSGGHYWFAVNKAAGLEFANIMAQVGAFPAIYKHSNYVKDNDPYYYYGSNGRLWTEIVTRVPRKAVELVGENYIKELLVQIDTAIKQDPGYLDNYVFKARFINTFYGAPRKEEALKLLDTALKQDPNILPDDVVANKVAQKNGRILWKQITGKEYPQR